MKYLLIFTFSISVLNLLEVSAQQLRINIAESTERTIQPGIVHRTIRTSSPTTDVQVLLIDMCTPDLHLVATEAPINLKTTSSWGQEVGATIAINADFYRTGPLRVYGDAIGNDGPWPAINTGHHQNYDDEWYYGLYGFISAQPGRLKFTHTGQVKTDFSQGDLSLNELNGIAPDMRRPPSPFDSYALVSGFPELVTEGLVYECDNMFDTNCFPDRSDMRERHPRSAMGFTEDRRTLILMTVDGRSTQSAGVYGAELAWLMGEVGAWQAFNLDGGGSSQLWAAGEGYLNEAAANNGGGVRSVANHLGIKFKEGEGSPHCPEVNFSIPAGCTALPPEGGGISESGPCAQFFGNQQYWRMLSTGRDGEAYWTNAWDHWAPGNWFEWVIHPSEAGSYEVEIYVEGEPRNPNVRYLLRSALGERFISLDQGQFSEGRWLSLGTHEFDAGAGHWLRLFDNYDDDQPATRREYVDSIRLRRLDLPPEQAGSEMAGGDMAGGEMAGGEMAGGEMAGGEMAGGAVLGGEEEIEGGAIVGGEENEEHSGTEMSAGMETSGTDEQVSGTEVMTEEELGGMTNTIVGGEPMMNDEVQIPAGAQAGGEAMVAGEAMETMTGSKAGDSCTQGSKQSSFPWFILFLIVMKYFDPLNLKKT